MELGKIRADHQHFGEEGAFVRFQIHAPSIGVDGPHDALRPREQGPLTMVMSNEWGQTSFAHDVS
jgi:hypothetical protein